VILIDSSWKIPKETDGGWLRIGLRHLTTSKMLGAVLRVENKNREQLCSLEEAIADRFTQQFWGRWLRMPGFVRENDSDKFDQVISYASHGFASAFWGYRGEPCLDVIGVIFPEEVRRCEFHDGWVFLRRNGKRPGKRKVLPTPLRAGASLVRAQRCGRTEISSRAPDVAFARSKKVAVVGLGCVGAPLALELAKVGVQLVLVDDDEVEFAPAVRWPLGLDYLGWAKSKALADFIGKQWPYCGVQPHIGAIGRNRAADTEIITGVDLVVDGTAELGVQRYVGDLAAECGKPVIEVSTTPGGWGGRLARFLPTRDTEPCRVCLFFYEEESYLTIPPADPNGRFQPLGCGDISFHALSADTTEISLAGARLVFSTLAEGALGAYPVTWWNVATLWLRSTEGVLIEPRLETWHLTPHPKCPNH
jgi:molybdopterin/thiamine biosynthesis adenylyltransferase